MKNKIIDIHRRKKVRSNTFSYTNNPGLEAEVMARPSSDEDLQDKIKDKQAIDQVRQDVAKMMNPASKGIFEGLIDEELTVHEMAKKAGITQGAVRTIFFRILDKAAPNRTKDKARVHNKKTIDSLQKAS